MRLMEGFKSTFGSASLPLPLGDDEHEPTTNQLPRKRLSRVLLLTDADVFAGTERHILALATALPSDRVAVSIGCPVPSPLADRARAAAIPVVAIAKRGLVDFAAIRTLRRMLKLGDIDIIHAHNGRTMFLAVLAVRIAGKGRCVATQHFLHPDHVSRHGLGGWVYRGAHAWVNRGLDHVIAISLAVRDAMIQRKEITEAKITTVCNGIVAIDRNSLRSRREIRRELGIGDDIPLIVCVARLQWEKDIPTLVAAMRDAIVSIPQAICVVAGEGNEEYSIRELIIRNRLEKSVRLVGFRSDATSLISAGDLFVLPSVAEPFGLVLLEAMSLEKPVIATRTGGPVEIILDRGVWLSRATFMRWQAGSSAFCPIRRREMRWADAVAKVDQLFTADRMAEAILTVYKEAPESIS